jgi:hypothetical protein
MDRLTAASEIVRCHLEIAEVEALIRAGHPDLEGLCRALADWWAEVRILRRQQRRPFPSGG